uniref:Uncharacterized protein n=1 Tax=Rhizophora mucronata TaxID=61149 RepID=A0A2P2KFQ0_RHIMU
MFFLNFGFKGNCKGKRTKERFNLAAFFV